MKVVEERAHSTSTILSLREDLSKSTLRGQHPHDLLTPIIASFLAVPLPLWSHLGKDASLLRPGNDRVRLNYLLIVVCDGDSCHIFSRLNDTLYYTPEDQVGSNTDGRGQQQHEYVVVGSLSVGLFSTNIKIG